MDRDQQRVALASGLDDPVRRRLYDYVSQAGQPVGRDEAAAAAAIGRPLAAYHLDRLVSLGLLTAGYRRQAGRTGPGAGRPAKVYTRSRREFAVTLPPREYELAARLLARAVESDPSGSALAGLEQAARQLGTEIGRAASQRSADRRGGREAMRATLAEHGFEPFAADEAHLALRNCPFHKLVVRHRDVVCAMNLALLRGVAAGIGTQDLHPALHPTPGQCCVIVRTRLENPMGSHDA